MGLSFLLLSLLVLAVAGFVLPIPLVVARALRSPSRRPALPDPADTHDDVARELLERTSVARTVLVDTLGPVEDFLVALPGLRFFSALNLGMGAKQEGWLQSVEAAYYAALGRAMQAGSDWSDFAEAAGIADAAQVRNALLTGSDVELARLDDLQPHLGGRPTRGDVHDVRGRLEAAIDELESVADQLARVGSIPYR